MGSEQDNEATQAASGSRKGSVESEYLLEHGLLDMVVHRHQLRDQLAKLLKLLVEPQPSAEIVSLKGKDAAGRRGGKAP